jgi:hypothetical protein
MKAMVFGLGESYSHSEPGVVHHSLKQTTPRTLRPLDIHKKNSALVHGRKSEDYRKHKTYQALAIL